MTTPSMLRLARDLSTHVDRLRLQHSVGNHIIARMAAFLGTEEPVYVDAENHRDQEEGTFSGRALVFTYSRVIDAGWTRTPDDYDLADTFPSSTATVRTFSRSTLASLAITADGAGGANVDSDWGQVYEDKWPRLGRLTLVYDVEGVPELHLPLGSRRSEEKRGALLSLTSGLLADLR